MKSFKSGDSLWAGAALLGAVGIDMLVCIFAGFFAGRYLSDWMGGNPIWILAGILSGFFVGVLSIIYIIRAYGGIKK